MQHEDGYCDECGCALSGTYALKLDGTRACLPCSGIEVRMIVSAKRPEARDDGR